MSYKPLITDLIPMRRSWRSYGEQALEAEKRDMKRPDRITCKIFTEFIVLVDILEDQQILTVFEGSETPEDQIAFVDRLIERSKSFAGFRLLGDMVWTRNKNWNAEMVHRLEKLTNHQRKNLPAKYICQYDLGVFSRDEAFQAMQTHNFTFYNQKLNACPYYDLAPK